MEPTRLTVRAIMSLWRAAHFERYAASTNDHDKGVYASC